MRFGCELYLQPIASFPFPGKRGHLLFMATFSGSSSAIRADSEFTEYESE